MEGEAEGMRAEVSFSLSVDLRVSFFVPPPFQLLPLVFPLILSDIHVASVLRVCLLSASFFDLFRVEGHYKRSNE